METIEATIGSMIQGGSSLALAAFLLLRMEKRIDELTKAIECLRHCRTCRFSPIQEREVWASPWEGEEAASYEA